MRNNKHWAEVARTLPDDEGAPLTEEQARVFGAMLLATEFGVEVEEALAMQDAMARGVDPADYAPDELDPVTGWPRWDAVRRRQGIAE